jgi:hypothetical protein
LKIDGEVMAHSIDDDGVLSVDVTTAWRGCLYATPVLVKGTYTIPYQHFTSNNTRATIYVTDSDLKVVRIVANHQFIGEYPELHVEVDGGQRIAYFVGANNPESISITNFMINYGNGTLNIGYEPYEKHSYPLDDSLTLRGIPKLDSSNNLYYDGDTYDANGTVTRKYGIRAYESGDESLTDAITDGTNTVYKLTTPTTDTAEPYTNPQIVDPYGTEEYVTTGIVPVGHNTQYSAVSI